MTREAVPEHEAPDPDPVYSAAGRLSAALQRGAGPDEIAERQRELANARAERLRLRADALVASVEDYLGEQL